MPDHPVTFFSFVRWAASIKVVVWWYAPQYTKIDTYEGARPMRLAVIIVLLGASLSSRGIASHPIQTTFSIGVGNGTYAGRAVFVEAENGSVHGQCHGSLILGEDVVSTTSLGTFMATPYGLLACDGQITPGGQIALTCRN